MTPKEQEWICEIAALNSASNTVTIAKICWKEIRRLRISQLRRMAEAAEAMGVRMVAMAEPLVDMHPYYQKDLRDGERLLRFAAVCLAEIERLRGMG